MSFEGYVSAATLDVLAGVGQRNEKSHKETDKFPVSGSRPTCSCESKLEKKKLGCRGPGKKSY